ncbi:TPA_exp: Cell surface GPI-anchored protein [Trichophyton benhamiae CBS 112371]|uniref:Cell surface GPI-anchored protein ARB_01627 n=1 Tax=Arthroderma benhamiae (strain ATCC MYA-4681 / CBS 112371) TaxID=663331 RepID=ECM33_ARTBC|nr:GPI-anchored cell wall protein Pst1, putative [Trichophyton benhamiae CBS 112371]D4AZK9.1 RecName: Full=Cell surface GPI-anchored protein ARB_01627; Flags: Precursor [Trichophyton benhamiae CBS 112371]EFE31479.1 GPI-anchored cell wall protein Pst1, putative [Trichophyton benhamiae CBS 112371]DAA74636.1 TPA_exp: Cell surface GPI-anchored protein [Trichophyton benhamiae CBS 112371]
MAITKYLVSALAVAGLAFAKDCAGDLTIENQQDVSTLSSCEKWDGDIVISEVVKSSISLTGVKQITGSLKAKNSSITELSAPNLNSIGDALSLSTCTALRSLDLSSLTKVKTLSLEALPKLQALGFTRTVSQATSILITNTDLTSLQGLDLETVGDFMVTNNPHLMEINVNKMTNITGYLNFAANNKQLSVKFPNLEGAHNMTFRNVSDASLPSLHKMDGLLGFYSNFFMNISAPNLTATGDLVFTSNSAVMNISMPKLETVKGGLQLANNSLLEDIEGFPALKLITGALDITGKFKTVKLPSLKEVRGDANLQSTETFGCDPWQKLKDSDVIRGKLTCRERQEKPKTGDDHSGGDEEGHKGAAAAFAKAPAAALLIAFVGALQFFL